MSIMAIGETVELERKRLQMTQSQLAEKAGTSRVTVWKIENGDSAGIAFGTVLNVLEVLGLDLTPAVHPKLTTTGYVTSEQYEKASEAFLKKWGL